MTPDRQKLWLRSGAALIVASGVAIALGAHPATSALARLSLDLLFWPPDGAQPLGTKEARLLAAIGGGVMIGWGLMLWHLAGPIMDLAPRQTRHVILTSVLAWFVADSAGSLAAGAWLNLVGNLVFLILFALPLRQEIPRQTARATSPDIPAEPVGAARGET